MTVTVRRISSKSDLKKFVKFPFELYRGHEKWVPPLIKDELDILDLSKNPSAEHCETSYWLAFKGDVIVGRIAGIIHSEEASQRKTARFGWLDFIDDEDVSKALLQSVENWARDEGLNTIHGPLGFTDMDFEGMLVEGFDEVSTIATIYNYPYYNNHLINLGYIKSIDWLEIEADIDPKGLKKLDRTASLVTKRFNLRMPELKKSKDIGKYSRKIFETLNESYSQLYGFHPLTQKEMDNYLEKYFNFLNPDFVAIVVDDQDKVVGFGISMPSLSEAFQKANGKLFPLGFVHILKALKKNTIADLYLIGVLPKYQNMGVTAIVIDHIYKNFIKWGIKKIYTNPILESNKGLLNHLSLIDGTSRVRKRRRCYVKSL